MGRKFTTPEQAEFNKYMGERLTHFREEAKVKRFHLAKQINVTPIVIKYYEDGCWQIPLSNLVLICKVLGNCNIRDFIKPDEKIDIDSKN